ncbi:MAG: hypothetical protein KDJ14_09420 [Xanthomonadales bacterium]|nr:hypothetical protein [Xanthomonadales bacterium]
MSGSVSFRREGQSRLWAGVLGSLAVIATWALWASDLPALWSGSVGLAAATWSVVSARSALAPHALLIDQGVLCVRWGDGKGSDVESVCAWGPLRVMKVGRRRVVALIAFWPEADRRLFSLHCRELARAPAASV